MARGRLTGFIATPKKGTTADSKDMVDIVEKTLIKNNTAYGEVNNPSEADKVIEGLRKLPQSLYVQDKVLTWENKRAELSGKIQENVSSLEMFKSGTESQLKNIAQVSYTDIKGKLIPSYASFYTDQAAAFEDMLQEKLSVRGGGLSAEELAYRKTLNDKANFYNSLANAYIWPNEEGKLGAGLNSESIAVMVDTNPATGKINNVEIVPADGSDPRFKDYMATDIKAKVSPNGDAENIPMFLRPSKTVVGGQVTLTSRLGDKVFQADVKNDTEEGLSKNVLKFQAEGKPGRNFVEKFFRMGSAGDVKEEVQNSGFSFDNTTFDSYDIPENSIVKIGAKTYIQPAQGQLYEIGGKTAEEKEANIGKFLSQSGGLTKDDLKVYYANRDFVYNPDGTSKTKAVIDDNFFKVGDGTLPGGTQSSIMSPPPPPAPTNVVDDSALAPQGGEAQSFFQAKNRPTGITAAPARTANDLIEKGKGFFRSVFS